jgi:S-adenosylmethionine hydrolase
VSKTQVRSRSSSRDSFQPSGLVTLLTDFGTADGYVGAVKGVILAIAPMARLVDITHEVAAGDVLGGALALEACAGTFPPGSIHLAVVDPGVGTERRAIAVESAGSVFVGPDNGLLSLAVGEPTRTIELDVASWHRRPVSATFHGRDLFAPVVANLVAGVALGRFGATVDGPRDLGLPVAEHVTSGVRGQVIHVDRFGNLISNITADDVAAFARGIGSADLSVGIRNRSAAFVRTYGEAKPGALSALVGSSGRVEIAVRDGSAAEKLAIRKPGQVLRLARCARKTRR